MGPKPRTLRAGGFESCRHCRTALVINMAFVRGSLVSYRFRRTAPPLERDRHGTQRCRSQTQNSQKQGFFFRCSSSDNVRILVAFLEFCRSFCSNQGPLTQNFPDTCCWLGKPFSVMVQRGKYCLLAPK